jgi:VIT1/CCC1 family predicted Fe2+/Mn2+ transporter
MPEEETEELYLIYRSKGFPDEEARAMAERIVQNQPAALDTLVREELGMSASEAGNPWVAALTSFLTFGVGAAVPLLPWLFAGEALGVTLSAILSAIGLFTTGAITTLFTGRRVMFSGTRMVVFGAVGALVSFAVGGLIGAGTGI